MEELSLNRAAHDLEEPPTSPGRGRNWDEAYVVPDIGAEYLIVALHHGTCGEDWELEFQELRPHCNRYYDLLHIRLRDGERRVFFFDISGFFGRRTASTRGDSQDTLPGWEGALDDASR